MLPFSHRFQFGFCLAFYTFVTQCLPVPRPSHEISTLQKKNYKKELQKKRKLHHSDAPSTTEGNTTKCPSTWKIVKENEVTPLLRCELYQYTNECRKRLLVNCFLQDEECNTTYINENIKRSVYCQNG